MGLLASSSAYHVKPVTALCQISHGCYRDPSSEARRRLQRMLGTRLNYTYVSLPW